MIFGMLSVISWSRYKSRKYYFFFFFLPFFFPPPFFPFFPPFLVFFFFFSAFFKGKIIKCERIIYQITALALHCHCNSPNNTVYFNLTQLTSNEKAGMARTSTTSSSSGRIPPADSRKTFHVLLSLATKSIGCIPSLFLQSMRPPERINNLTISMCCPTRKVYVWFMGALFSFHQGKTHA